MSGRNRLPPHHPHYLDDMGPPQARPPPPRDPRDPRGPHHHPHYLDDVGPPPSFGGPPRGPPRPLPPHHHQAAIIMEDRMGVQHEEIQVLLVDNQRLAATHVALKQEVAAAQHELQRVSQVVGREQAEGDARIREIYENSMKMEADLRAMDAMRAELTQVRGDIQKLNAQRQELTGQVHMLTQDLSKATAEVQQAPAIKAEIEYMKQELQQARLAIEHEKKGYAENYEQGQGMEKNLISMAREVEKLRAEVANATKRARAATAVGNQGAAAAGYNMNYANPDPSYGGNPYPSAYSANPVSGTADGGPQYATGANTAPGHGSWAAYDMHHAMRR